MCAITISVTGLALGFLGSVLLAFSLSSIIRALVLNVSALDTTLQAYIAGGNVPVFTELDVHIDKGKNGSKICVMLGIFMLAIGYALQAIGLLCSIAQCAK